MSKSAQFFLEGTSEEHNVPWLPCLGKGPEEASRVRFRAEVWFPWVEASGVLCLSLHKFP